MEQIGIGCRMNVYCIDFPNNKKYVGIESNTGQRKQYHSRGYTHTLVGRAVNKHGWENCKFRYLIINAPDNTCYHVEKKLIRLWKLQDPKNGYNISEGGEKTNKGYKRSKEAIRRQHETRRKNGYIVTKTHKNKIRNTLKGKKHTRQRRLNLSKTNGGKPFYVLKDDKIIGKFELRSDAAIELNLHISKIGLCLNGKRNTHKGYKFKYVT